MPPRIVFFTKTETVNIDVSLVAVLSDKEETLNATAELQGLMQRRNNKKHRMYSSFTTEDGELFFVAAATANGTLSSETQSLIKIILENSNLYDDSKAAIEREIRVVIAAASGHALMNAERKILRLPSAAAMRRARAQELRVTEVTAAVLSSVDGRHLSKHSDSVAAEAIRELLREATAEKGKMFGYHIELIAELASAAVEGTESREAFRRAHYAKANSAWRNFVEERADLYANGEEDTLLLADEETPQRPSQYEEPPADDADDDEADWLPSPPPSNSDLYHQFASPSLRMVLVSVAFRFCSISRCLSVSFPAF